MLAKEKQTLIVSSARTPMGAFAGKLANFSAAELGGLVLKAALERAGVKAELLQEVIMGCVVPAGQGQAPARQAAKHAGIPDAVGALTINKVCGSSLKAICLADQMIRAGDAEVIAAGGMESMSNIPYYLPKVRSGLRLGHGELIDGMILDGLWDPYNQFHMGSAGERCARNQNVSRQEQDAFTKCSYERALAAIESGSFQREMVAVDISKGKGAAVWCHEDEEPKRGGAKLDKLATLRGAFEKEGSITAANSSKISDGACAVVVMSQEKAKMLGIQKGFRIVAQAQAALAPEDFPIAPVAAIRSLLEKTNLKVEDVDRFEINEAFAVVALVARRQLQIPEEKLNVRGGAVALGHPIGVSGARIVTTLMHILEDAKLKRGVAAICLGGGEAVSIMVEAL